MWPEQATTRSAAQVPRPIAPTPPPNTCADPSKAVQNPSKACLGYETARPVTLKASRTGLTSDAQPAPVPSHACLTLCQNMVTLERTMDLLMISGERAMPR